MKTSMPIFRSLKKVLPLALLFVLASAASLLAEQPLNPYGDPNPVVALDEAFMTQLQWLVAAIGFIFLFALFILVGALHKHPEKLTLMGMLNSVTAKNAADPEMHHEYDGIRELDNPIPGYLQVILYGSIVFGIVYLLHYHVLETGPLSAEEYEIEMAEAELKYKDVELPESALIMITDAKRLDKAATLFADNCATCHGAALEGDSGPNLTDPYWLHGGKVKTIYGTISEGVPGKTMIGWKKKLSSLQRLELASYILSMQGTNPPNAKEPEGTLEGEDGQSDEDAPAEEGEEETNTEEIPADEAGEETNTEEEPKEEAE